MQIKAFTLADDREAGILTVAIPAANDVIAAENKTREQAGQPALPLLVTPSDHAAWLYDRATASYASVERKATLKQQIAADIDSATEEKLAEYVRVKEGRTKEDAIELGK